MTRFIEALLDPAVPKAALASSPPHE